MVVTDPVEPRTNRLKRPVSKFNRCSMSFKIGVMSKIWGPLSMDTSSVSE
jgi:hypothetical protein